MAEDFDAFIASALAPAQRDADRRFVARVQAHIVLEERLARERRAMIVRLGEQLLALCAVAVAVWLISRAAPVAEMFAKSPAAVLSVLLAGFAFVLRVFSLRQDGGWAPFGSL